MIDQNSRPARKIGIADHLWETYETMAQQMGSDRDALINQALFMFARLNGFIEVSRPNRAEGASAPAASAPARAPSGNGAKAAPPMLQPVSGGASKSPSPPRDDTPPPAQRGGGRANATADERPPTSSSGDNDPARREVAERVLETAAELERLIKGKSSEPREEIDEEPLSEDDAEGMGMDLGGEEEPPHEDEPMADEEEPPHEEEEPHHEEHAGGQLMLLMDNQEPQPIAKERFVIGRGKHCDLVINSGKVSREHAVIVRDGDDFFIEDLGSSNGTWFNKQRIKRRKVEDGDEYFICSERVRLAYQ